MAAHARAGRPGVARRAGRRWPARCGSCAAQGTGAQGTGAQGTGAQGTGAQGVERRGCGQRPGPAGRRVERRYGPPLEVRGRAGAPRSGDRHRARHDRQARGHPAHRAAARARLPGAGGPGVHVRPRQPGPHARAHRTRARPGHAAGAAARGAGGPAGNAADAGCLPGRNPPHLERAQSQAELKRLQSAQEWNKAALRERLATLVAPVSGTVQQLAAHTEGGVVTEAQALMVIVPDGAHVSAEVTLENKDIGFVEPGQDVTIKLETFPFTRYGTVPAHVETVTRDAVNDEKRGAIFPALLKLDHAFINVDGKDIKLAPGMNLTAEIKTGQRRVIEYLLSPIQKAGSESLRER
nr:HlyD family efflux transporter periplasmic adaptor subunit [Paracidovorax cattleyae]